jgi:hypothetical protein
MATKSHAPTPNRKAKKESKKKFISIPTNL